MQSIRCRSVSLSTSWLHIDKSDVRDYEWNWKTFTIIAYFILSAAICIMLSLYLCTYLWQLFQFKYLFTQERCFLEGPAEWWVYVCVKRWLAVSRSSKTLGTWKLMTSLFSVNDFQAGSLEAIAKVCHRHTPQCRHSAERGVCVYYNSTPNKHYVM